MQAEVVKQQQQRDGAVWEPPRTDDASMLTACLFDMLMYHLLQFHTLLHAHHSRVRASPLQMDSCSSKCRSNQKATAFISPAAVTSSFRMLSRPLPLRSPSEKYSNTLQGLVRQVWVSWSKWQVS